MRERYQQDHAARELQGHDILSVCRFRDSTRWMIEFTVLSSDTDYGEPGNEVRLFLDEESYQAALTSQRNRKIKIRRYAKVIEGHVLPFRPK